MEAVDVVVVVVDDDVGYELTASSLAFGVREMGADGADGGTAAGWAIPRR